MRDRRRVLLSRIRWMLALFLLGLVLSGLTAFPLEGEISLVARWFGVSEEVPPAAYGGVQRWIATVHQGIRDTHARYPFMAYGTDWLAFAHLVIAVAFIGPLCDPVRNLWVLSFGLIACVLVVPVALICGPIRGIPWYHQLVDCSFGVAGFIPLWFCRKWACELEVGGKLVTRPE